MKLPPLKKLLQYGGILLSAIIVLFIVIQFLMNIQSVFTFFAEIASSLRSIFIGCVLAYVLYPLAKVSERFLLAHSVSAKTSRLLSTLVTVIVLLAIIVMMVSFIIPQLVMNLPALLKSLPHLFSTFMNNISSFLSRHGQDPSVIDSLNNTILEKINSLLGDDLLNTLTEMGSRFLIAAKSILDFIIGIIVMVYALLDRDIFIGTGKKFIYAVFPKHSSADHVLRHLRVINEIFSGYVSGKLLDSLIIGIITGICLGILNIPYALIIALVIGLTNIIPVFGPFFGAIPSTFLLLLTDPKKAIVFLIFIVILQQIDGNIIGPKILGNSTGLSAFWVLFALLLCNQLMGFWGMVLGVPLFASIAYLVGQYLSTRLKEQGLPVKSESYRDVDHINKDGTFTYMKEIPPLTGPYLFGENSRLRQFLHHLGTKKVIKNDSDDSDDSAAETVEPNPDTPASDDHTAS